jgi:hypothetical protein
MGLWNNLRSKAAEYGPTVGRIAKKIAITTGEVAIDMVVAFIERSKEESRRYRENPEQWAREHGTTVEEIERGWLGRSAEAPLRVSPNPAESPPARIIADPELGWQNLEGGLRGDLSQLRDKIGLYRMTDRATGEVVYIGKAVEFNNGGLRKRLSDYTREGTSGRKHKSGRIIHENMNNLKVEVFAVNNDEDAVHLINNIEALTINLTNPSWNTQYKPPMNPPP